MEAPRFVEKMVAVAFLVNEKAGAIGLATVEKRELVGLGGSTTLRARLKDRAIRWPALSLEARIRHVAELAELGSRDSRVSTIIFGWLGEQSSALWKLAADRVGQGLVVRQMLSRVQGKRLAIISVSRYEVPASTASLVTRQRLKVVDQLIAWYRAQRPGLWALLVREIRRAVENRDYSG
jgi:hypothetical protein